MANRAQTRQQDAHYRILRLLEEKPTLTQRELSNEVGISLGALNYCLKSLVKRGAIKIRNFRGSDRKLAYAYVLTPAGLARKTELAVRFLDRKLEEYRALKAEIESLQRDVTQQRSVS